MRLYPVNESFFVLLALNIRIFDFFLMNEFHFSSSNQMKAVINKNIFLRESMLLFEELVRNFNEL